MLITTVTEEYSQKWIELRQEKLDQIPQRLTVDVWRGFEREMNDRINQHEAFMAKDRISNQVLGIVAFSKKDNRITFFAVSNDADYKKIANKLLDVALNQLDKTKEITAAILNLNVPSVQQEINLFKNFDFVEDGEFQDSVIPVLLLKRPSTNSDKRGSFHHNYSRYMSWTAPSGCPVCKNEASPPDLVEIKELEHTWVEASRIAQGTLWGKCHVLSKKHYVELHDIPMEDLKDFMSDVQKVGKALKEVSGAVKINYELHGNSMPHLHVHLFPRYLDDPFPAGGIDVNKIDPDPYESDEEFQFFIEQMRKRL